MAEENESLTGELTVKLTTFGNSLTERLLHLLVPQHNVQLIDQLSPIRILLNSLLQES
jgi:hypothetical protein